MTLALIPALTAALASTHACGMAGSPEFAKQQLRDADVYAFLAGDVLDAVAAAALDSAGPLPWGVVVTPEEAAGALRPSLPPAFLRAQTEDALDALWPYAMGDADTFEVTFTLQERADAVEAAIARLLGRVAVRDGAVDALAEEAAQRLDAADANLLGVAVTPADAEQVIARVLTPSFVRGQQQDAAAALAAYLVGRTDTLDITIDLSGRTATVEQELTRLLDRGDVLGHVRETTLSPALRERLTSGVTLPLGVVVPQAAIQDAADAALAEWLETQREGVTDAVVRYLSGRSDGFEAVFVLSTPIDDAAERLAADADARYEALFAGAPRCTSAQLWALANNQPTDICLPEGIAPGDALWALGIDVDALLRDSLAAMAPSSITVTHDDLRAASGAEGAALADDLRRLLREGVRIDAQGLHAAVDPATDGSSASIDTVRRAFTGGWRWTERDLHDALGDDEADDLDDARRLRGAMQAAGAVTAVLALALLAAIALTGGRSWQGRLMWLGGALTIASLCVALVAVPAIDALTGAIVDAATGSDRPGDLSAAGGLVWDKAWLVAGDALAAYTGGLQWRAIIAALVGAYAAAGGGAWAVATRVRPHVFGPREQPPQP